MAQLQVKRADFVKQMQPDPSEHRREDIPNFAFEHLEELQQESNHQMEQRFTLARTRQITNSKGNTGALSPLDYQELFWRKKD